MDYKPTPQLMEGLHFSETDLDCNRQGILSQAQQETLKNRISEQSNLFYFFGVLLMIFIGAALFVPQMIDKVVFYTIFICLILGTSYALFHWNNLSKDFRVPKLIIYEGNVRVQKSQRGGEYYVIINGFSSDYFKICPFVDGALCRIFVLQYSKTLLSAEYLVTTSFSQENSV
jgi:hypothetical protein